MGIGRWVIVFATGVALWVALVALLWFAISRWAPPRIKASAADGCVVPALIMLTGLGGAGYLATFVKQYFSRDLRAMESDYAGTLMALDGSVRGVLFGKKAMEPCTVCVSDLPSGPTAGVGILVLNAYVSNLVGVEGIPDDRRPSLQLSPSGDPIVQTSALKMLEVPSACRPGRDQMPRFVIIIEQQSIHVSHAVVGPGGDTYAHWYVVHLLDVAKRSVESVVSRSTRRGYSTLMEEDGPPDEYETILRKALAHAGCEKTRVPSARP